MKAGGDAPKKWRTIAPLVQSRGDDAGFLFSFCPLISFCFLLFSILIPL